MFRSVAALLMTCAVAAPGSAFAAGREDSSSSQPDLDQNSRADERADNEWTR
jgi:hypothetical protein